MIEQTIDIADTKWRVKARTMKDALNEIAHARCTGSIGSISKVDNTLIGGDIELIADVHKLDDNGDDDVVPS